MKYVAPQCNTSAFHCPFPGCGNYARQAWKQAFFSAPSGPGPGYPEQFFQINGLKVAFCDHCGNFSVWRDGKLLDPAAKTAPMAHPEMPKSISADYEEARSVYDSSLGSSAALLRLAIQKLCKELGQPGKNLNDDIGELVARGLPAQIQQSLDIVRVVGNNQVHPGSLDVRDILQMAMLLFELVNLIVEDRIAQPARLKAMFEKLPEEARKQIAKRDTPPTP